MLTASLQAARLVLPVTWSWAAAVVAATSTPVLTLLAIDPLLVILSLGNDVGVLAEPGFSGKVENNNIYGNRFCGLVGPTGLLANNNYWGQLTGPVVGSALSGFPFDFDICTNFGLVLVARQRLRRLRPSRLGLS